MKKVFTFPGAYPILILLILSVSCQQTISPEERADALMELDRQFSIESEENGISAAINKFIDDDAVLLRSNRYPVKGKEKIIELFSNPDTDFVLTWEPSYAYVSKSGDLGYTYGIYKTESLSPEGEVTLNHGTYVTIWKKDPEGNWKFIMDTGNSGLERKKPDLEN
jgi:ketosteroid isomerase-like protein